MKKGLPQDLRKIVTEVLRTIGGPTADQCLRYLDKGCWGDLVRMTISPCDFTDASAYRSAAQAIGLLKKLDCLDTGINTAQVAEEAFLRCEAENHRSNRRLEALYFRVEYPLSDDPDPWLVDLVRHIRKIIKRTLGPVPYDRIVMSCEMTAGTTYHHKGAVGALVPTKLSTLPESTNHDIPLFTRVEETLWWRIHHDALFSVGPYRQANLPLVKGNRFSTVPKDSTKDRGICVEPTLNLFAQKGVGTELKRILRRIGLLVVPPDDTTTVVKRRSEELSEDKHRRLARKGSLDGSLATIDLSDASDTICFWLVKLLLPEDWFSLLERFRSPATLFRGKWHILEKFSSMGNGFTFELETLLFYGIVRGIMESRGIMPTSETLTVYGDDIICPCEVFDDVISALRFFGLTPNPKKSFSTGPFRESCGGDYFLGCPVRPVNLTEAPTSPLDWVVVHNLLWRLRDYYWIDGVLNQVRSLIPTEVRKCVGPPEMGDTVLHSEETEKYNRRRRQDKCWQRVILPITGYIRVNRFGWQTAIGALILSRGTVKQGFPLRDDIRGYRVRWVPVR